MMNVEGGLVMALTFDSSVKDLLKSPKAVEICKKHGMDLTDKRIKIVKGWSARKLAELKKLEQQASDRMIFLQSVVEEIGPLELEPDEDIQIEEEYRMLKNSTDIIEALMSSKECISSDDECIISGLRSLPLALP